MPRCRRRATTRAFISGAPPCMLAIFSSRSADLHTCRFADVQSSADPQLCNLLASRFPLLAPRLWFVLGTFLPRNVPTADASDFHFSPFFHFFSLFPLFLFFLPRLGMGGASCSSDATALTSHRHHASLLHEPVGGILNIFIPVYLKTFSHSVIQSFSRVPPAGTEARTAQTRRSYSTPPGSKRRRKCSLCSTGSSRSPRPPRTGRACCRASRRPRGAG